MAYHREYKAQRIIWKGAEGMCAIVSLVGEGSVLGIKKPKSALKLKKCFINENNRCFYGNNLSATYYRGCVIVQFVYSFWKYHAYKSGLPHQLPFSQFGKVSYLLQPSGKHVHDVSIGLR